MKLCDRFLSNEVNLETIDECVPTENAAVYYEFQAEFIANGAPDEINISDKKKKRISDTLSMGVTKVPFNVFDQAADEILLLLYQNTYKKYLTSEKGANPLKK